MENKSSNEILSRTFIMLLLTSTTIFNLSLVTGKETETYIVQLSSPGANTFAQTEDLESWYRTFLPTTTTDADEEPKIVHAYRYVLTGFAVKLTIDQVKEMEEKDGVLSVQPQSVLSLHTTYTPRFLGLQQNLGFWRASNYGKGIIVGVLDSGISPGHPSYKDDRVDPPPAKWKGKCEVADCNNKLIGARNFVTGGSGSPLDENGHGTHTSSTAAGNFVEDASALGNDNGTAAGMAPLAHIAMYKVCGASGCADGDMLAGMDAAIDDGVDVLSLSIGGPSKPFYTDSIAKGGFAAIKKGIFLSCSAGNSGPENYSVINEAPWILTVGASTVDRKVLATVTLGNGTLLNGESLFQPKDFPQTLFPLVYPGIDGDQDKTFCAPGSLDSSDVFGKVVLCEIGGDVANIAKSQTVKDAGGVGMILTNDQVDGASTLAEAHVIPTSHVCYKDGITILDYINSTSSPIAGIEFHGTVIGDESAPQVTSFSSRGPSQTNPGSLIPDTIGPGASILPEWTFSVGNSTTIPFNNISGTSMSCPHLSGIGIEFHGAVNGDESAPQVASFSSRGPSRATPGILKPDIIGPGVNILAAWPFSIDNSTTIPFNVDSGTSMSCPHLSGIAALLKNTHPDWSPAAIKSAIMTTADMSNLNGDRIEDEQELPASFFAVGAGHVNPSKANDPGLIYDIQPDDYIPYLCGLGYTSQQVMMIVQKQVSCEDGHSIPSAQLNYPSFAVSLGFSESKSYTRTVTNVGDADSSYTATLLTAPGLALTVSPSTLTFSAVNQKLSYEVTITGLNHGPSHYAEGVLIWQSAKHSVRSPISVWLSGEDIAFLGD